MKNYLRYLVLILAILISVAFALPLNKSAGHATSSSVSTSALAVTTCEQPLEDTFDVLLPKVGFPSDDEGQDWARPKVWGSRDFEATDDIITVPNGRPIYALFVSGYGENKYLDELVFFNFARHLMSNGAYVHYAWWNNLLAPYMERPLHHNQSHPGNLQDDLTSFLTAQAAASKAFPGEDYQFVADATRFISAIREHNPNAIVMVVGHDMGGGAVIHLAKNTNTLIDLLAPIDPVGNRNYPWSGLHPDQKDFNWTRWRVTRDHFLGYKSAELKLNPLRCEPVGPFLKDRTEATADPGCEVFVHNAPVEQFDQTLINLHHRYQTEALLPFDFQNAYFFAHNPPPGGTTSQLETGVTHEFCGPLQRCLDPGGWPLAGDREKECCESLIDGVGWPLDGHSEIVGYRGPVQPVPLGVRVRTSEQCGDDCSNKTWPGRTQGINGIWFNGAGDARMQRLRELELLPTKAFWEHTPSNPDLCLVSPGLIARFNIINKPPVADAGADQTIECAGSLGAQVTLDGRGSTDPDNDGLEYHWQWSTGQATTSVVTLTLPKGTHCFTLTVRDPSGHIDQDVTTVTIQDTTPPQVIVGITPRFLWPPNHKLWSIHANVQARDLCGDVADLKLISIVSSQPDNGVGDGNTINDIQGATLNTLDLDFLLRAERNPQMGDRFYTITYQATDDSGNRGLGIAQAIVPRDGQSYKDQASLTINPIDDPAAFVWEHYQDFLNREPDEAGMEFWANEITSCGTNANCVEVKRINVSAAFFLSTEFQETGYFVYRMYKSAYGNTTSPHVAISVPIIRLDEFLPDAQRIGLGVSVGIGDWQNQLKNNKIAYAREFVARQRFLDAYPLTLTPTQFVNRVNSNAGSVLSQSERAQLIAELTAAANVTNGRASILQKVAENADLRQQETNRAFVLMEYFGYLRRNPDNLQDTDFRGWEFWLNKLNRFKGNFVEAEMVKAFLVSEEYRQRFGP